MPDILIGRWTSDCSEQRLPDQLSFAVQGLTWIVAHELLPCRLTGLRNQTARRWYLDFQCRDGVLIDIDVNLLVDGTILLNERPLGAACLYARAGDP
ncbi:MAG: hypothetical protein NW216_12080 [Hyphomicrobium sp.]|nr:hypothetical protein [Hyphomicrobium sp.]